MCGRLYFKSTEGIRSALDSLGVVESIVTANNVYPGIEIPVVIDDGKGIKLQSMSWRYEPSLTSTFNVRIESLVKSSLYRKSAEFNRAIVFVDGFVIWRHLGKTSEPFYITAKNGVLALGAIWTQKSGKYCVGTISQRADEQFLPLADRMPLLLSPEQYSDWFNSKRYHVEIIKTVEGSTVPVVKTPVSADMVSTHSSGEIKT